MRVCMSTSGSRIPEKKKKKKKKKKKIGGNENKIRKEKRGSYGVYVKK